MEEQKEVTQQPTAVESKEEKTPNKKIDTAPSEVGVGDTAKLAEVELTVNDIQCGYVFPMNIPKPQVGNQFCLANVTMTNTTSNPVFVSPLHFKSQDARGARLDGKTPRDIRRLSRRGASAHMVSSQVLWR